MKIYPLILTFIFLIIATGIAYFFENGLLFLVGKLNFGWVFASIFIRLLVILFLALSFKKLFSMFNKTAKMKSWVVVLIACLPGLFLSFITTPIYNVDYGDFSDNLKLEAITDLSLETNNSFTLTESDQVIAFLDLGCSHCKESCKKLAVNHKQGQKLPIHLFFYGDEKNIIHFIEQTEAQDLMRHTIGEDYSILKHSGFEFPSIFLVNPQGKAVKHWVGDRLNYTALDYLLNYEQ